MSEIKTLALSTDQAGHLADLVSLAMIGFALVKQHGAVPEDNPALASFMPLVRDELDQRKVAQLEKASLNYGIGLDHTLEA